MFYLRLQCGHYLVPFVEFDGVEWHVGSLAPKKVGIEAIKLNGKLKGLIILR